MERRTAIGILGAAFVGSPGAPARAADLVRMAAPALDGTGLVFYADDGGFFRNAGLDAEVQALSNGEAVTIALTGGAIDIGCSEAVTLILAHHRGIPITLLAAAGLQTPNSAIGKFFVQKDSTATSGRDMDGKTVAVVGLNGFAQYGTQAWLDRTGGTSSTVKFIQLAGAQMAVALQDGRIDGAFVPEPFVSLVAKVARPIADPMSAIAPTLVTAAFFAMLPWAQTHADDVRRFQSAIRAAAEWANKNRDQTALILERVAHVAPEIVQASTRSYYGERLDPSQLQPLIDVAAKYGGFPPFPAAEMIYRA